MHSSDLALVELANSILAKVPGSSRVKSATEINAQLFVSLYEGLFAETLRDVVRHPKTSSEKAHNVQAVIDTVSLDVLNTSLSHLSGEAIVAGDKSAVRSLLEVFAWLFKYILEGIPSETASEIADDESTRDVTDPDLVTSELIDSILDRELGRNNSNKAKHLTSRELRRSPDTTDQLIALGEVSTTSSRNQSASSRGEKTSDLIALGQTPQGHDSSRGNNSSRNTSKKTFAKAKATVTKTYPGGETKKYTYDSVLGNDGTRSIKVVSRDREGHENLSSISTRRRVANKDSSQTSSSGGFQDDRGYKTTEELIRESRELHAVLSQPKLTTTDSSTDLEFSLATNTSFPRPLTEQEQENNTAFRDLGSRPLTEAAALSSNSVSGHQYNNFTHHLYHHYDPVTNVLDPMSQSLPIDRKARQPKVTTSRDTQVTPGRFKDKTPQPQTKETDTNTKKNSAMAAPNNRRPSQKEIKPRNSNSHSYDNLRQMVEETVNMSQNALTSATTGAVSKRSSSSLSQYSMDPGDEELSLRLMETLIKLRDPRVVNKSHCNSNSKADIQSPGRQKSSSRSIMSSKGSKKSARSSAGSRSVSGADRKVSFSNTNVPPEKSSRSSKVNASYVAPDKTPYVTPKQSLKKKRDRVPLLQPYPIYLPGPNFHQKQQHNWKPNTYEYMPPIRGFPTYTPFDRSEETDGQKPTKVEKYISPENREALLDAVFQRLLENRRSTLAANQRQSQSPASGIDADDAPDDEEQDPYLSDGFVDYGSTGKKPADDEYTGDFKEELAAYKRQLLRRGYGQRFDDVMDEGTRGRIGHVRRRLRDADKHIRVRSEFLKDKYEQNLHDFDDDMQDNMDRLKMISTKINKEYKKRTIPFVANTKPAARKRFKKVTGSVLWPKTHFINRMKKRNAGAETLPSSDLGRKHSVEQYDTDILPFLLKEFPYLNITANSLYNMWKQAARQIKQLGASDTALLQTKNKQQHAVAHAEWKYQILTDLAKKDISFNNHMRDIKDRREQERQVKYSLRDKRLQHAKSHQYYDKYSLSMRSKMLAKRSKDELVFRHLFQEGLRHQKMHMNEINSYAKDQRIKRSEKQQNELDSVESHYRERFKMLTEAIQNQNKNRKAKTDAQRKAIRALNREFRSNTEKEIEEIQENLFRDTDCCHFREMDGERLMKEMQLAKFTTPV